VSDPAEPEPATADFRGDGCMGSPLEWVTFLFGQPSQIDRSHGSMKTQVRRFCKLQSRLLHLSTLSWASAAPPTPDRPPLARAGPLSSARAGSQSSAPLSLDRQVQAVSAVFGQLGGSRRAPQPAGGGAMRQVQAPCPASALWGHSGRFARMASGTFSGIQHRDRGEGGWRMPTGVGDR
jgi:hypothetical protein